MNLNLGETRLIIREAKRRGVMRQQLAYILATARWETAHTMRPVREAFWLSEQWRKDNLRYYPWYGRGFVQLTWAKNYRKAGSALNRDFMSKPDKVMQPNVAAEILVKGMVEGWFTGRKLGEYIDLEHTDYHNARRIVNGTDKAAEIAELAEKYDAALRAEGYGERTSYSGFLRWLIGWLAGKGKQ